MTYLISDLCGRIDAYKKMLALISLKESDVLYVLGNSVGKGIESIELLTEMSMAANVLPILGVQDYEAFKILNGMNSFLKKKETPDSAFMSEMAAWVSDGGQETLDAFRELDPDMQEGILDYLSEMVLYEELTVNGADYLLVSQGIVDYTPDLELDICGPDDFLSETFDLTKEYDPRRVIITGSTCVNDIPGAEKDKIYYGKNMIGLNCNIAGGGKLACLCLETGQEYYVN